MRRTAVLGLLLGLCVVLASQPVWAYPAFARQTKAACAACHLNVAGGAGLTDVGKEYKEDPSKATLPADVKATDYVGSTKCKMCHLKQHKAWLETPHAKAWAGLAHADEKKVAEMAALLKVEVKGAPTATDACVQCHVTGFQLPGGYPAADSTKNVSLQNVTCEGCHGPGAKHVTVALAEKKKFINKPSENMCRQCHTADISPKFNFEEFKKKGVHQVAAAAPVKTKG